MTFLVAINNHDVLLRSPLASCTTSQKRHCWPTFTGPSQSPPTCIRFCSDTLLFMAHVSLSTVVVLKGEHPGNMFCKLLILLCWRRDWDSNPLRYASSRPWQECFQRVEAPLRGKAWLRGGEKFGPCREIARFLPVAAFGAGNHQRRHTISTLSIRDLLPRSAPNGRYSRVCH